MCRAYSSAWRWKSSITLVLSITSPARNRPYSTPPNPGGCPEIERRGRETEAGEARQRDPGRQSFPPRRLLHLLLIFGCFARRSSILHYGRALPGLFGSYSSSTATNPADSFKTTTSSSIGRSYSDSSHDTSSGSMLGFGLRQWSLVGRRESWRRVLAWSRVGRTALWRGFYG